MFRSATASLLVFLPSLLYAQEACPRADLPAYAHNDYANARPLMDALSLGFRGAEADVFLVDGTLRLGHDRRSARRGGTLESRYLKPLEALLARCGSLTADETPFLLTIELKESSRASHDSLVALLGRYSLLFPAIEVVLVGWHPEPAVLRDSPVPLGRQVRLGVDSLLPPTVLDDGVRLMSLDYGKVGGGWLVQGEARRRWIDALREVKAAHPDRRLRVHNVPVSAELYRELRAAGVDLIGTRQLTATAAILRRSSHW